MADSPDAPARGTRRPARVRSGSVAAGPGRRRRGRALGMALTALAALAALAVAIVIVVLHQAQPPHPGSFYSALSPLPTGAPGTIIRSEPLDHLPAGTQGWKILYLSTGYMGKPAAISGVVIVPTAPPPRDGRKVVAWAHGTVGVAARCAPSILADAGASAIDGLPAFLAAGDAVVATYYQGLGTPGPHPYLVGKDEAIAVLDSVRAAHNLPQAAVGTTFVVWGASQGGHAALFTGQYASSYAPDLTLAGVAAAAPAAALLPLFQRSIGKDFGNVLSAFAIDSWAQVYPALSLDQIVSPLARPLVRNAATYCIQNMTQALPAVLHARILKLVYLSKAPWETEPWKGVLETNTAGHMPIRAPIFIGQGAEDMLVRPDVQATVVKGLCAAGETVQYRTYPGVDHLGAGPAATPDVTTWIADRFAGKAAPRACG